MTTEEAAPHLAKWRSNWPEWQVAEVFVPEPSRESALAWATLLQELTEAAWGGADPRPGEAKLGWWQEEFSGWTRGARRHPLGAALQRHPASWHALAAALPALAASRERPVDAADAFAAMAPFSSAAVRVEGIVLGGAAAPADEDTLSATLLYSRLARFGDAAAPLSALAAGGDASAAAAWADMLRGRWPVGRASTVERRLWATLARTRLDRRDPLAPLPPWRVLPIAWRAARR